MLFIGDDWAEAHHDIEIEDDTGRLLVRRRLLEGLAGISMLHELVAEHLDPAGEPDQVMVGIETERGSWVGAAGRRLRCVSDQPDAGSSVSGTALTSGASPILGMRICWPRSSGWIGPITDRSPATPRSLRTLNSPPVRIRP